MNFGCSPHTSVLGGVDRGLSRTFLTLTAHSCQCKFLVPRLFRAEALDNLDTMPDFDTLRVGEKSPFFFSKLFSSTKQAFKLLFPFRMVKSRMCAPQAPQLRVTRWPPSSSAEDRTTSFLRQRFPALLGCSRPWRRLLSSQRHLLNQ